MKKIYLVKKDVNKPSGEGNWIKMTPYEFAQFMKTPEGQSRKKNFAQLDGCDYDDDIIVAECEEKLAKKIRAEKDAHDYLMSIEKEMGYTVFSYNELESSEDELNGEELLEDIDIKVDIEAIKRISVNELYAAIDALSDFEQNFIREMFLTNEPLSETNYAKKHGLPRRTVGYQKKRILNKLKNLLDS